MVVLLQYDLIKSYIVWNSPHRKAKNLRLTVAVFLCTSEITCLLLEKSTSTSIVTPYYIKHWVVLPSVSLNRVSGLRLMRGASCMVLLHSALSSRADSIALLHSILSSLTFPTFELSLQVALSLKVACGRSCIVVLFSAWSSRSESTLLLKSTLSSSALLYFELIFPRWRPICGRSCIVVLYSTLRSRAGSVALVYSVLSSAFV